MPQFKLRALKFKEKLLNYFYNKKNNSINLIDSGNCNLNLGKNIEALKDFMGAINENQSSTLAWLGFAEAAKRTGLIPRILDLVDKLKPLGEEIEKQTSHVDKERYRLKIGLPITDMLIANVLISDKFKLLDGGAREADADMRWGKLPPQNLTIYGFEPEPVECTRLNNLSDERGLDWNYYPVGIWSENGELQFHENYAGGGSSFLLQNQAVTDRWKFENPTQISLSKEIFRPKCSYSVRVTTLESWALEHEITNLDFIKLNVQGGELEILKSCGPVLDSALGLLCEVSFCESYLNRPFFSDIDIFLRKNGFVFFDLLAHHYIGRADSPIAQQHLESMNPKLGQLTSAWGQLIEGHALYLRDPIQANPHGPKSEQDVERALRLACIAEIYGQIEFAFELIKWSKRDFQTDALNRIEESAASIYQAYY